MNFDLKSWLGQVTTGHGVMILGPTLLAVAGGAMTWQMAVPLLVAGAVGLLWPENAPMKAAAQSVATDIEAMLEAYEAGLRARTRVVPGVAAATVPGPPAGTLAPTDVGKVALILMLAGAGLLAGCVSAHAAELVIGGGGGTFRVGALVAGALAVLALLAIWRRSYRSVIVAAALALSGCVTNPDGTVGLSPNAQQVVNVACAYDPAAYTAGQIGASIVPVPGVAAVGSADAVLVHPFVVAACAKYGMKPAAVVAAPATPSPVAPAPVAPVPAAPAPAVATKS